MAHELRRRYPPDPDAPAGVPAILRGGPAELYRGDPRRAARAGRPGRGAPAADPRARHALGDGRADADRRRDARRHHAGVGRERAARSTTTTSRSPRTSRCAPRPRCRTRACTPRSSASPTRCRRACCRSGSRTCPAGRPTPPTRRASAASDVGGDFYDILPVESGHLVVLGDVTGKGVEAAALTSLVRHSGRMAARFDPRPARVLVAHQPGAARAAAALAGDRRVRAGGDQRRHARG